MKRLLRYILRDKVDLLLLITSLSMFTLMCVTDQLDTFSSIVGIYSVYVFGTMVRLGIATDCLNEYVTDPDNRAKLNLK
jgi:hypothetical protein